jgi:NAD(P)-dependent dehydrogenase (short-subunit alcohol dehydrogenase family)
MVDTRLGMRFNMRFKGGTQMAAQKWTTAQMPAQTGKIALVTGANSGIGYQAALELARHGAHVLLGCRSAAKGRDALERLLREAPGASAEVVELDMASLASIRAATAAFAARGIALDLLIDNAGVMALATRELTPDGFERQFGTNHLGHFALTGLLMPQLLAAPAPRVVTVASLAHRNGKIEFDNLQSERKYKPWNAYGASKLANILFAKELDRRAHAVHSRLVSVAVHPGVSQTSIVANGPGANDLKTNVLFKFAKFLTSKDDEGALPTLYAATAPGVRGGEYIGPDGFQEFKGSPTVVQPRPRALDEAVAARLWVASEQLTGVSYPALG